jgi:magnesium chelatase subunit H
VARFTTLTVLLRRQVLKFLPMEKAQDARHFVESLQYWQGGNPENLENLILSTSANYVPALKGVDFAVAEPQLFPEVGIWHPLAPAYYEDLKEYLNWWVT